MHLRDATKADTDALHALLDDYMLATFGQAYGGTRQRLHNDLGQHFQAVLAEVDGVPVGFGAWSWTYDLHHGMRGACLMDLYVQPDHRRRGLASRLMARIASQASVQGGTFIMGQSVEDPDVQRLYERVAVCFPGANCYVSGKAFRALAALADSTEALTAEKLPDKAWNKEP